MSFIKLKYINKIMGILIKYYSILLKDLIKKIKDLIKKMSRIYGPGDFRVFSI